jgi:hypothetical protein
VRHAVEPAQTLHHENLRLPDDLERLGQGNEGEEGDGA